MPKISSMYRCVEDEIVVGKFWKNICPFVEAVGDGRVHTCGWGAHCGSLSLKPEGVVELEDVLVHDKFEYL